ncbi:BadF/BadG/BcrA/BcrD ATPase family protein [Streptomyces sp. NBC_00006]|uniref:N-acetylglucosamine kinase n=1 Tax=Streptomyces sp. NBC_00006 TaxID=2975619 RepID=UPI002B1DF57A|nr:BadF/BadG/BcrA/BcrD ATPase family protein [Streptomyces sp. NBC_00006]
MSALTAVLAVDVGKTGCRAALWTHTSATTPPEIREASGAPGLAGPDGVTLTEKAVLTAGRSVLDQAGVPAPTAVCVGAAGAATAPQAADELARRLRSSLAADEVAVTSDAITSHAGALGGSAGIVLAAGTGTVAVGFGHDGSFARADGWGPWLGDEGSGSWIGRAGLRAALRAHDGRGPESLLAQAARQQYGPLEQLPAALDQGGNTARATAAFAPAVAKAAAAGDSVADAILREAATAWCETVIAVARRLGDTSPLPVTVTGGLARLKGTLPTEFDTLLLTSGRALPRVQPLGGSLEGARLLASRRDAPHEAFVTRVGPSPV